MADESFRSDTGGLMDNDKTTPDNQGGSGNAPDTGVDMDMSPSPEAVQKAQLEQKVEEVQQKAQEQARQPDAQQPPASPPPPPPAQPQQAGADDNAARTPSPAAPPPAADQPAAQASPPPPPPPASPPPASPDGTIAAPDDDISGLSFDEPETPPAAQASGDDKDTQTEPEPPQQAAPQPPQPPQPPPPPAPPADSPGSATGQNAEKDAGAGDKGPDAEKTAETGAGKAPEGSAKDGAEQGEAEASKESRDEGGSSGGDNAQPQSGKPKKRMGDRLVEMGLITRDQLGVALHEQQRTGKMLGSILVELGFIDDMALSNYLAESTGFEIFDPKTAMIDPEAMEKVPKKDAMQFQMLPLSYEEGNVIVAMADPYDVVALDKLRQCFPRGTTITPQLATPAILNDSIDNAYGYASSIEAILKELATGEAPDITEITAEQAYSHPIVRLVNALVWDAVKIGASDLHFEPEENFVRLRYRIDGVLRTVQTLHKEYWSGISQRLKILAEMDIADKLNPQDGRFNMTLGAREADFRVSALPTVHGENIVLRVLDKSTGIMPLDKLGFNEHNANLIQRSLRRPEGIIIVTGPTGSGKTTTMYSMLGTVNTVDVNIMTLEDPVEFPMPLMRQAQVKEGTGLTFAEGVKSLLRQDPDIIFIGEVRDLPTAEQALKAAMTGHQVFTTLHTNDCFGAIPRLTDLGLKPGMIAGAIIASFAQRLCRRLCPECKEAKPATEEECHVLGADPAEPPTIYHPKGCDHCDNMGYKGRVAVAEILTFDDDIDEVVARGGHKHEIKDVAVSKGFRSMADDAVEKVLMGLTSLEAATKVVNFTDRL